SLELRASLLHPSRRAPRASRFELRALSFVPLFCTPVGARPRASSFMPRASRPELRASSFELRASLPHPSRRAPRGLRNFSPRARASFQHPNRRGRREPGRAPGSFFWHPNSLGSGGEEKKRETLFFSSLEKNKITEHLEPRLTLRRSCQQGHSAPYRTGSRLRSSAMVLISCDISNCVRPKRAPLFGERRRWLA